MGCHGQESLRHVFKVAANRISGLPMQDFPLRYDVVTTPELGGFSLQIG